MSGERMASDRNRPAPFRSDASPARSARGRRRNRDGRARARAQPRRRANGRRSAGFRVSAPGSRSPGSRPERERRRRAATRRIAGARPVEGDHAEIARSRPTSEWVKLPIWPPSPWMSTTGGPAPWSRTCSRAPSRSRKPPCGGAAFSIRRAATTENPASPPTSAEPQAEQAPKLSSPPEDPRQRPMAMPRRLGGGIASPPTGTTARADLARYGLRSSVLRAPSDCTARNAPAQERRVARRAASLIRPPPSDMVRRKALRRGNEMILANILVHVDSKPRAAARLALAVRIAERTGRG